MFIIKQLKHLQFKNKDKSNKDSNYTEKIRSANRDKGLLVKDTYMPKSHDGIASLGTLIRELYSFRTDTMYLRVRSSQKQLKQESILSKKKGVKAEDKVNRRIGRATERYPSISKLYDIELQVSENKTVSSMTWKRNGKMNPDGLYFVRCSEKELTEEIMWKIYNTIREIESTFRCLKTDLDIRPVFHQKDVNSEAHLFIGILVYQLVHAIREELKTKGIRYDWKHIRNIMSSHILVTTRMKLENKDSVIIRQPARPNQHAAQLYAALNFKQSSNNMRKKSVVPNK